MVANKVSLYIFFSGDMDSICSLTATRYSVKDLNLTITHKWRPWYTPDNEVMDKQKQIKLNSVISLN